MKTANEVDREKRALYLRAQALISRVYELPEGERNAFVESETKADSRLRHEVRWLLDALNAPDDKFLEKPAAAGLNALDAGDLKVPAPRKYTLIRPLGEGGTGVVYLAERVEGKLKQQVALKLLTTMALMSPLVVSRFLTERQLLARLNHPNIARLIDAGALSDGRPFLAMEYIQGQELDAHCRRKDLSIPQRLRLFAKVCQAVQYAHQHLVIHRDLKPANILVDEADEPKLVDFGIAKSWSGDTTAPLATQTVASQRIMTLAYASPEQLSGEPVGTTTDVYSLGVILYELLAGERPWGNSDDPLLMSRARAEEVVPPSVKRQRTQLEAQAKAKGFSHWWLRVMKDLHPDLDAIVMKALRQKSEERYLSVQSLADDIENHLTNRPVEARKGQAWYSAGKSLRRHWIAITVCTMVTAMTAGYIVDRQQQLKAAEGERLKVQQVRDFLIGLFKEVQPAYIQGQNISARQMLDRSAKRLETDPPADPITRLTVLKTLGETYFELGERRIALGIFNKAIDDAKSAPHVPDALLDDLLYRRIVCENLVGSSKQARIYIAELLARLRPRAAVAYDLLAKTLQSENYNKFDAGMGLDQLEAPLKEANALMEKFAPNSIAHAAIKGSWAYSLKDSNRYSEAIAHARHAVDIYSKLLVHGKGAPETVETTIHLGFALCRAGLTREGLATFEENIRIGAKSLGSDHIYVNRTKYVRVICLGYEERWAEAAAELSAFFGQSRKRAEGSALMIVTRLSHLVHNQARAGELDEAERGMREEVNLIRKIEDPEQRLIRGSFLDRNRAVLALARGRYAEAETIAKAAAARIDQKLYATVEREQFMEIIGDAAFMQGNYAESEAIFRDLAVDDQPLTERYQIRLAKTLMAQHRFNEADALLSRAGARLAQNQSAVSTTKMHFQQSQQHLSGLRKQFPEKTTQSEQGLAQKQ